MSTSSTHPKLRPAGPRTPGAKLDQLLAQMSLISEASAATLDKGGHTHPESKEPPGAWSKNTTLHDETGAMLERLIEALTVELARAGRSGDYPRRLDEGRDERILNVWKGKSPKFVSFVENVPEPAVIALRSRNRRRAA